MGILTKRLKQSNASQFCMELFAILLAQNVIQMAMECNDCNKELAKPILELLLCRILGLSGLTWEDQHLLSPVWMQLRQHSNKPSKENILRSFFQDMAKNVPTFWHFRNSTLFDNIINYHFESGPNYKTSNKTPNAIWKHHSKLPPPLFTTTVAKFMQLVC
jgi:hypothetical protein